MSKYQAIAVRMKSLWAEWLSFAVFTQAGSALEGSHRELYDLAERNFTRYGIEKRRM